MGDRVALQVGGHRLGVEAVVQQHARPGARAAPENRLAADVVERQASQPEIARVQRQMLVGGGRCSVETGVAQHHAARLTLAAAGRDDERDAVRNAGGRRRVTVAVNRKKSPIFKAARIGVTGEVEAGAGNDDRRWGAPQVSAQRAGIRQQFGEGPALPGATQRKRPRPALGSGGEVTGERSDGLHKPWIISSRKPGNGEADQEICGAVRVWL